MYEGEKYVYDCEEKCGCDYENSEVSKVGIVSYSVELDENQDYVTIKVVGGFVEPVVLVADLVDYGLNLFDKEQYESNKKWRADLVESIENFIVDKLPADQAYYYYCGTFGGRVADLTVGAVALFNGAKGIIKSVLSYDDGVKVLHVALDNGDEALMMLSDKSDEVVMLSSKLDDVVDANKLHHIFGQPKHNLDEFLNSFNGNQEEAYRTLLQEKTKYVETHDITGIFEEIVVNVNGYNITVSGNIVDGIIKIGTAYIP